MTYDSKLRVRLQKIVKQKLRPSSTTRNIDMFRSITSIRIKKPESLLAIVQHSITQQRRHRMEIVAPMYLGVSIPNELQDNNGRTYYLFPYEETPDVEQITFGNKSDTILDISYEKFPKISVSNCGYFDTIHEIVIGVEIGNALRHNSRCECSILIPQEMEKLPSQIADIKPQVQRVFEWLQNECNNECFKSLSFDDLQFGLISAPCVYD